MLIIGRKRDQKIIIAGNIEITILEIGRNRVRFGIEAPRDVPIQTRTESGKESASVAVGGEPAGNDGENTERTFRPRTIEVVAGQRKG